VVEEWACIEVVGDPRYLAWRDLGAGGASAAGWRFDFVRSFLLDCAARVYRSILGILVDVYDLEGVEVLHG
jgi:hypothetical protein